MKSLLSSPSPVPNPSPKLKTQSPEEREWDWGWHYNPTGHPPPTTSNFSHPNCQSSDGKRPTMTFLDFPWPSLTFHDLLWPSMTFYHFLRPLWPSMIKCLLSRPGLIARPLHSGGAQSRRIPNQTGFYSTFEITPLSAVTVAAVFIQ